MDVKHDLHDDKDPDVMRVLDLDEEDDGDVEHREAHIIQWVELTIAVMSTDGEDDNPFAPMDMQALVAKFDSIWSQPFHASSMSLALIASPQKATNGELWNLYDSGANHHMTPICKNFITFQMTVPKSMTAVNQQEFNADRVGDVIISVPNGSATTKIRLTSVLYTPSIGLTLISIS